MKNKFLSLALVAAVASLFLMQGAFAVQSSTGAGTSTVAVTEGNLTLTLEGQIQNPSFSLSANASDQTDTSTGGTITVLDNTATAGHHLDMQFNSSNWSYDHTDGSAPIFKVNEDGANNDSVANDEVNFLLDTLGSVYSFSATDSNVCTYSAASGADMTPTTLRSVKKSVAQNFHSANSNFTCGGTLTIAGLTSQVKMGATYAGTLTLAGTVTLTDGN